MADAGPADNALLTCDRVSVDFAVDGGVRSVLRDISFTVAPGEFVSVVGPSGTGKTTLLRALSGLHPLDGNGTVHFRGELVSEPPVGLLMVFQNYAASLLPWRTIARNVELGLEATLPVRDRRARVSEALELVGLSDRAGDYPWQLSGGMQQRVQIARALAMRPEVLLMDEPFGALDAMTKAGLQDELAKVQAVTGATIVFVTHDIDEAVYLSDRVLVVTGSPARISHTLSIDLERPRSQVSTKEQPEYLAYRREIHAAIRRFDAVDEHEHV